MAEDGTNGATAGGAAERPAPVSPTGGPASPPRVLPLALLYTLGRVAVFAVLVAIIWFAGLPGIPALLFGILLSMPASYFLLRPLRDRLTEALVARRDARLAAKADLRDRLSGAEPTA